MRFRRSRLQWSIAIVVLVALLGVIAWQGWDAPVEDEAASFFAPLQRGLRRAVEPLANLVGNLDDFDRFEEENRALRQRIEQLEADNARLRELQLQVRGRAELLEVQAESADELLPARVIIRDLTGLRTVVGIDRGANDGVTVGMAVLAVGGTLAGIVTEVQSDTCYVRLITDPDSAVRVLHQPSRTESVATGDTLGNLDAMLPWSAEVELGHIFVTSGLDGLLPQGLPVARVSSATGSVQEAFRQVRLQPLAPLEQLEQVLVQLTFSPPDLRPGELDESESEPEAPAGAEQTSARSAP